MVNKTNSDLFKVLRLELGQYWSEVLAQADRNVLRFPPSHSDKLGHVLFANLRTGGRSTLLVTGNSSWDPQSHYYDSSREAARRGLKITRFFLLPHRNCRHNRQLYEHMALDKAAGIITQVLYIGELLSSFALPIINSLEIGLWDEAVACVALYGGPGMMMAPSEWRVSDRAEDIELQRQVFSILETRAIEISLDGNSEELELEEPMVTTAPIVQTLAPVLCQGDHVSPEDCSWYHAIWQYLRIFDMVSTPTWHASFYINELGELAKSGRFARILISGTADYSMLAHVLWAYRSAANPPAVSVLDLCETPLFLCKWYAKFVGTKVNTISANLLTFSPSEPFDVVVTDAFLTRFPPPERPGVISKWHALLRPEGRLVTTVRIESGLVGDAMTSSREQVVSFRSKALQEARRWQGFLGLTPEDIAAQAARYAERIVSYSICSVEELAELLERGGFAINRLIRKRTPGEMESTLYCEVVARRM